MLEFLQYLERIAPRLEPAVLILPGLFCVLFGLFAWLAGLRYARIVAAFVGAFLGGFFGFCIVGRKLPPDIFLAITIGTVSMLFHKILFVFLALLIAVTGVTYALADAQIEGHEKLMLYVDTSGTETISTSQTITMLCNSLEQMKEKTIAIYAQFSILNWVVLVGIGMLAAGAAVYFNKLISAVCCAVLGTTLNFTGMILLLFYKGAEPVTGIGKRSLFFLAVFAVMVVLGTAVQLILCPPKRKKRTPHQEEEKKIEDKESEFASKMSWMSS